MKIIGSQHVYRMGFYYCTCTDLYGKIMQDLLIIRWRRQGDDAQR